MNAVIAPTVNVGRYRSIEVEHVRRVEPVAEHQRHRHQQRHREVGDQPGDVEQRGDAEHDVVRRERPSTAGTTSELNTTLPWVFIAPFGGPVVPDV